ncbi:hypothetical protein Tco_0194711, partial [Tanacetum coccineum]
ELVTGLSRVPWEKVDISFHNSRSSIAAHSVIQVLNEAYQILNDPVKRDVKACKVEMVAACQRIGIKEVIHSGLGTDMICGCQCILYAANARTYAASDKMEVGTTTANLTARLPILNPGDYDLWLMRIEQYFLMTDYSLWEVIKNGNKVLRRTIGTIEQVYEPTTAEEK